MSFSPVKTMRLFSVHKKNVVLHGLARIPSCRVWPFAQHFSGKTSQKLVFSCGAVSVGVFLLRHVINHIPWVFARPKFGPPR